MTSISILGITVSSMAMLIVFSAFSGLKEFNLSLQNHITSDIKITPKKGKSFLLSTEKINQIQSLENTKQISTCIEEKAFFSFKEKEIIAYLKGVDTNYTKIFPLKEKLYSGRFYQYGKKAVIGSSISSQMGISANNIHNRLKVFVPSKNAKYLNTINALNSSEFRVTGLFHFNNIDFDSKFIIVPIDIAQQILGFEKSHYSSIEISLQNSLKIENTKKELQNILGKNLKIKTKKEQNLLIYRMINIESLITYFVFVLILIIAIFTLSGVISILILDKKIHLKTLHSIGMPFKKIENIFIYQGIMVTIIGCGLGLFIGGIICVIQQQFQLVTLNGSIPYPIVLELKNFVLIALTVLGLGYITSVFTVKRSCNKL